MRVKCNTRSRYELISADTPLTIPRVIRFLTLTAGERLVAERKAKRLYASGTRVCIGFQMFADNERPVREREPETKLPPTLKPLSTTFTKGEVQVLSRFEAEKSATARQRAEWNAKGYKFDPDRMDAIERTVEKQRVYQKTH